MNLKKNVRKVNRAKKHTKIEKVSIVGVTVRMSPLALHMYAADFLSIAKGAALPAWKLAPARTFLVCRTLELGLKAYLSLKKYSLEQLAGGALAHDLEALLAEAERHGLCSFVHFGDSQRIEIRRASVYYVEKVFEYPAVDEALRAYPKRPDTTLLIGAAEKLVAALHGPCLTSG